VSQSAEALDALAADGTTPQAGAVFEPGDHVVYVRGLRRVFGTRAVLDGIDLMLKAGDFVALLGPSGTGKTTLLRILAGLDTADSGQVLVPRVRSVVFQEPRLVMARKVWRNVVIGHRHMRKARAQAIRALTEVGLETHSEVWPVTLSGGEAQRVALARALATEPALLLLDEPFASLDALTRIRMHDLVAELYERHQPAVILVTHDVDEAIQLADRVLVLSEGTIGLDVVVGIRKPRQRDDPRFLELRSLLLSQLGVSPTVGVTHSEPATTQAAPLQAKSPHHTRQPGRINNLCPFQLSAGACGTAA
jgi:sulfonate transport system ATP-binding protein